MLFVCAWCGEDQGRTEEGGDEQSHGICMGCKDKYFPEFSGDAHPPRIVEGFSEQDDRRIFWWALGMLLFYCVLLLAGYGWLFYCPWPWR